MVINKKIDKTIMGIVFCLKKSMTETKAVHINNGRVNVSHVSSQVSVRNFAHTGLNKISTNKPKASQ